MEPTPSSVAGHLYVTDASTPASSGYEIWLLDHTAPSLLRGVVGADGGFAFPLTSFTATHSYSLHAVKDFRELGAVDLAPSTSGVQALMTYQGGYGFDAGDLILTKDALGRVAPGAQNLTGALDGGFSLAPSGSAAISDLALPSFVKTLTVASELRIFDPLVLLEAFYGRASAPTSFARELAAHSRIHVRAEGSMQKLNVAEAGDWLPSTRLATGVETTRDASPLWSATAYAATGTPLEASAFVGAPLAPASLVLMRILPQEGAQAIVPVAIPHWVAVPPQVTHVAPSGGTRVAVDYASRTAANGLTRPFCATGASVPVTIAAPRDESDAAWSEDIAPVIELAFDYVATGADGRATAVSVDAAAYGPAFRAAFDDTVSGVKRSWNPATRVFTLTMPSASAAATSFDLTLPSELLIDTAGGTAITRIRTAITARYPKSGAIATSVVWLARGC